MNSKERIVKEAFDLFSARGYAATSVRDIAAAVGIKDSSLYNHYKSKQEIFYSVIETYSVSCTQKFFSFYDRKTSPQNLFHCSWIQNKSFFLGSSFLYPS